jgi:hypothetical protein
VAKTEHAVVTKTDKPAKAGTPSANKVSGSSVADWRAGDKAPQYNKKLKGFTGVDRGPKSAAKQIFGGSSKSVVSARETRDGNDSFDKSSFQKSAIKDKSMSEGKLR